MDAGAAPTLTADRLTEAVLLGKLPATADGHAGGWAVAPHPDRSLEWIVGGAAEGTHTSVTVPGAYTPGVPVTVVCTLSVDTTGIPRADVYLNGVRAGHDPHVPASTPVTDTTTDLLLGAPSVPLTDVRICKRAPTTAEDLL
ncbi:hypothetical protein [Streptomyces sp. NPDC046942]|uniref:hypothetical protein n=1 Tax=Streptomyces sp. NPDC046942 TaxID=3155137 RepID=UPI0033F9F6F9